MEGLLEKGTPLEVESVITSCNQVTAASSPGEVGWYYDVRDLEPLKGKLSIKQVCTWLNESLLVELTSYKYSGIEEPILFKKEGLEIGCNSLSKKDAVHLAKRILWAYS